MNHEYILLKALADNKHRELYHADLYALVENQIGHEDFKKLLDDFYKKGYLDEMADLERINKVGLTRFAELKTSKKNSTRKRRLTTTQSIIAIVTPIAGLIITIATLSRSDKSQKTKSEDLSPYQTQITLNADTIFNNQGFTVELKSTLEEEHSG
ncbi:MAG: hypothetical protein ABJG47_16365 [Ekhidna sp.]